MLVGEQAAPLLGLWMLSRALLSGRVEAVVATFGIRLGRLGARSGFGVCGAPAGGFADGAGAVRAASSAAVAHVSLIWSLYPFQKVSRLALLRASVS